MNGLQMTSYQVIEYYKTIGDPSLILLMSQMMKKLSGEDEFGMTWILRYRKGRKKR